MAEDIIFCGTMEEKMREADLSDAYLHRSSNRHEVTPGDDQDAPCACAYCCSTFDGTWIWQWAGSGDGERARCPVCGLDAVISILHVPKMADPEFRDAMYARFYDTVRLYGWGLADADEVAMEKDTIPEIAPVWISTDMPSARLLVAAPTLLEACRVHAEWIRKDSEGPIYPAGTTRDSPGGEHIWKEWWQDQLDLCAKTEALGKLGIAKAEGTK